MSDLTPTEQAIVADARDSDIDSKRIEAVIADVQFYLMPGGGSTCQVICTTGYIVHGFSNCPDGEDSQSLAYTDAVNKLWDMERYHEARVRSTH
jgi:hypothetical protein